MISFYLDIVESVLAGSMPNSCNGAARLPFKAGLAYLLHVLWPVNLALFKPSPHVLEPTWVGQSSQRRCGQMCGPCGLDRGPLILYSWPLSPNAKLSLGRSPYNPAKAVIEHWKTPGCRSASDPHLHVGLRPVDSILGSCRGRPPMQTEVRLPNGPLSIKIFLPCFPFGCSFKWVRVAVEKFCPDLEPPARV